MRSFWTPWAVLVLAVTAVALFSGCTSADQWRAAGSTFEIQRAHYNGGWSLNKQGDREGDMDGNAWVFGIHPFAYWGMKMQAEANARAMTEAQYASRTGPPEKPK